MPKVIKDGLIGSLVWSALILLLDLALELFGEKNSISGLDIYVSIFLSSLLGSYAFHSSFFESIFGRNVQNFNWMPRVLGGKINKLANDSEQNLGHVSVMSISRVVFYALYFGAMFLFVLLSVMEGAGYKKESPGLYLTVFFVFGAAVICLMFVTCERCKVLLYRMNKTTFSLPHPYFILQPKKCPNCGLDRH